MLPYFPFDNEFDHRMGTAPLRPDESLVEVDDDYEHEIGLKRELLTQDYRYYFQAQPGTEIAQWDVLERLLTEAADTYPQHFSLTKSGSAWHWINHLLSEEQQFTVGNPNSLPLPPLDWVGQQVQEDLIILSADGTASLVAGQLCFPNGWCLDDKFGQTFLGIHRPAPSMVQPTLQAAHKLLERIPEHRPIWRASWNFKITDQLDMSTKYTADYNDNLAKLAPTLTADTIGDQLFIRIERQTFTRLPNSGAVLFGIHTYQNSLASEAADSDRAQRMLGTLRTTPSEMLAYKAIAPFEDALIGFLENRIHVLQ
ncbi:heme-dependent oxidative N-demethylase family protein [Spirosoma validum]|uniref:DUF3445 domain-containing protein n=1 Tax=Spirosoma validum TaxID=2771355 RepID=A0A927GG46_9BACT|nr:DUF3445 domain-containing protein [Spirosoma validum]MBD2756504.1 DUF3445 domain-containing protein [Spirosoma validum]